MEEIRRWGPNVLIIIVTLFLQGFVAWRLAGLAVVRARAWGRPAVWVWLVAASLWMAAGLPVLSSHRLNVVEPAMVSWLTAATLFWVLVMVSSAVWLAAWRPVTHDPSRRRLLALVAPVAAAPVVLGAAGAGVARAGTRVREQRIVIPGLAKDLEGLRIAQLTDIHYGPFLGRRELERAVAMANETKPHLALVTGDLITRQGDDLETCLRLLAGLKAEAGIYGCHGNHERYAGALVYGTRRGAELGLRFLRDEAELLRFGGAGLNLVGDDYQGFLQKPLWKVERHMVAGATNVIVQHNPGVFPRAAQAGFDLMLAGHTHGGQINLEIAAAQLNIARVFTPFVRGHYRLGRSQLYVSSGLGTVGVPIRLGAPPEVTLIQLCGG